MTDTPRTSEEWRRIQRRPDGRYGSEITYQDLAHGMSNFAKQLERELAAVTEQRDRLAEAARTLPDYDAGLLNDLGGGDAGWWQDYIRAEIGRANEYWREALAAVKGGSDE